MRVGLNLLHALPEIGGVWHYAGSLVNALGEIDRSNEYVAFVTDRSECLVPGRPNFERVRARIHSINRPRRVLYENSILPFQARKFRLDCMHWFANTQAVVGGVPGAVSVYDLQVFHDPSVFPFVKRRYLRAMIRSAARRAAVLLPMSQATANDLQTRLGADPAKMIVIPSILDEGFVPAEAGAVGDFRARYALPEHFWLYVAHFYPHKNHVRLLRAYADLKRSGFGPWPLVLRGDPHGAEAPMMETLRKNQLDRDVIFLPRLSKTELPLLYSAASAMVFPSLYEGGGMPVAEAMSCGCPVAGSAIPAVIESAGDAALYFDPGDAASMGRAMAKLEKDISLREALRRKGLAAAARFRPGPIIGRLLEAYARAARGRN